MSKLAFLTDFYFSCTLFFPILLYILYGQLLKYILRKDKHIRNMGILFFLIIFAVIFFGIFNNPVGRPGYGYIIVYSLMFEFVNLLLMFNYLQYYYIYAVIGDAGKFEEHINPRKNPSIVGVFTDCKKVGIFAIVSLCLTYVVFFLTPIYLSIVFYFGQESGIGKFLLDNIMFSFGWVVCFIFLFCYTFLRMLVKCPNCNLDIFYPDKDFLVYRYIAKRVIKDKVVECYHCHACYTLDPDVDLEKLRQENIRIHKERKKEIVPQYCW